MSAFNSNCISFFFAIVFFILNASASETWDTKYLTFQ